MNQSSTETFCPNLNTNKLRTTWGPACTNVEVSVRVCVCVCVHQRLSGSVAGSRSVTRSRSAVGTSSSRALTNAPANGGARTCHSSPKPSDPAPADSPPLEELAAASARAAAPGTVAAARSSSSRGLRRRRSTTCWYSRTYWRGTVKRGCATYSTLGDSVSAERSTMRGDRMLYDHPTVCCFEELHAIIFHVQSVNESII